MKERKISEETQSGGGASGAQSRNPETDQLDYILDLRTVIKALLKWSWIIIVFTVAGLIYGIKQTSEFTPLYTAKLVISPQSTQSGLISGTSATGGGGLTSKLEAVLGSGGASGTGGMFERLKLIMKSQQLARRLDEKYRFSAEIFASSWDSEKGEWKSPLKMDLTWRQQIDVYLHQTQSLGPGTEALAKSVGGMIEFNALGDTGFWEVSVKHAEADVALRRLVIIFTAADELLREQDSEKMREQVQYLRSRTKSAELAGLRAALYSALIGKEKSLHMMESGLSYAADIIEPAYASALKTTPNLLKTVAGPAAGAGFIGFLLVFLLSVFLRE
jgi:hypothetical protein